MADVVLVAGVASVPGEPTKARWTFDRLIAEYDPEQIAELRVDNSSGTGPLNAYDYTIDIDYGVAVAGLAWSVPAEMVGMTFQQPGGGPPYDGLAYPQSGTVADGDAAATGGRGAGLWSGMWSVLQYGGRCNGPSWLRRRGMP